MSTIKSFSVGVGDMFYINHGSDNFTMIDCCLSDENSGKILGELKSLRGQKTIARFISTHPDDDHLRGIESLVAKVGIENFYVVKNLATKEDETDSFKKYCELRDSDKAFHITKGCKRKWMNQDDDERKQSGIQILWPDPNNKHFKAALKDAENGESPNNISAVIQYSLDAGANVLWMGDLETAFMEAIEKDIQLPEVTLLFAPHHGRRSGRIPSSMLVKMSPKIIIVGEAPSEHLHYYGEYNTITQNMAGDIIFECESGKVHVFTSNEYEVDFLDYESKKLGGYYYVGTLNL